MLEVRFFIGNGEGIEVLAKPIFVRGVAPSMEVRLAPFVLLYLTGVWEFPEYGFLFSLLKEEEGGELKMSVEVKLRKGEAMEKALRRLKKKLDREGVIRDIRQKRYFEKPSEIKRRKNKVAAFNNMLRQRYENR